MSLTIPSSTRGPALLLELPASAEAITIRVVNHTSGKSLSVNLPSAWPGADLILDWRTRTITDTTGADWSSLMDAVDNPLWITSVPVGTGVVTSIGIEAFTPLLSASQSPGTVAGAGWTSPSNAKASDNAYAVYPSIPRAGLTGISTSLELSNFGFAVPATALIAGIQLALEGHASAAGVVTTHLISLWTGGVKRGVGIGDGTKFLTAADTTLIFGGPSNDGNLTWTAAQINASTFTVSPSFKNTDPVSTQEVNIDAGTVTIYWREKIPYKAKAILSWEQGYY